MRDQKLLEEHYEPFNYTYHPTLTPRTHEIARSLRKRRKRSKSKKRIKERRQLLTSRTASRKKARGRSGKKSRNQSVLKPGGSLFGYSEDSEDFMTDEIPVDEFYQKIKDKNKNYKLRTKKKKKFKYNKGMKKKSFFDSIQVDNNLPSYRNAKLRIFVKELKNAPNKRGVKLQEVRKKIKEKNKLKRKEILTEKTTKELAKHLVHDIKPRVIRPVDLEELSNRLHFDHRERESRRKRLTREHRENMFKPYTLNNTKPNKENVQRLIDVIDMNLMRMPLEEEINVMRQSIVEVDTCREMKLRQNGVFLF